MKATRDIKGLIKAVGDRDDYLIRRLAAKALGEIGDTLYGANIPSSSA
jgi:hypothetical protein